VTVQDPATGKTRFAVVPASYVLLLRETEHGEDGAGTEVLLQLRRNTGYMDGFWAAAAAGHVERGETAEAAARREALEEIAVTDLDLTFATAMQRTAHDLPIDERIDFFFTARSWSGEPRIVETAKCADLRWFPLSRLPDPVVPHEAVVLAGLRRGDLAALTHHGF
jgi:8-oxo-dGTP diphosphatase